MIRAAVLFGLCLALAPLPAHGQTPHHMTKPDGELDTEICAACHNEDFSLQRSKLETCTLCHSQTLHAGSDEHLKASAAAVKRALEEQPEAVALPLAEDGRMYCGTCHLFHDPKVASEQWLAQASSPRGAGLPGAIRGAVIDRWAAMSERSADKAPVGDFAADGTRLLRLPANDGQLCLRCHGSLR